MKPARQTWVHLYLCLSVLALSTSLALGASLKGKVKKKVYYSPAGNFSVPVPKPRLEKVKIDDAYDEKKGFGAVSFHTLSWSAGEQQGIHYMVLPPEAMTNQQPDWRGVLERWLHGFAMQVWFLHVSPKSRVLHEAFASFEGLNALLAEVEIPEGSFVMEMRTGKRLDSRRGLVIFQKGRYIYMLTTEVHDVSGSGEKTDEQSGKWMEFTNDLKEFHNSIVFTE